MSLILQCVFHVKTIAYVIRRRMVVQPFDFTHGPETLEGEAHCPETVAWESRSPPDLRFKRPVGPVPPGLFVC